MQSNIILNHDCAWKSYRGMGCDLNGFQYIRYVNGHVDILYSYDVSFAVQYIKSEIISDVFRINNPRHPQQLRWVPYDFAVMPFAKFKYKFTFSSSKCPLPGENCCAPSRAKFKARGQFHRAAKQRKLLTRNICLADFLGYQPNLHVKLMYFGW